MSHTDHVRGTRPKRQMLAEEHKGKRGQTRAKRADTGKAESIAESFALAEELEPFFWE